MEGVGLESGVVESGCEFSFVKKIEKLFEIIQNNHQY